MKVRKLCETEATDAKYYSSCLENNIRNPVFLNIPIWY